ncbi:MarR family transcriptional regulator [Nocardiopsis sediminis]|uniref:MarR family transcriptional regulator n=1 Tax=Nocardiopsis sediminis TaxID=1778267 RepID=A0ABV8FGU1_9ACTN
MSTEEPVSPERAELLRAVADGGRRMSNAAVMFHTALAGLLGIGASDWKTMDLLERHGPQTAGELVRLSGLAPASITGVIDRLERRGYVRRRRDDHDRRRVVVELGAGLLERRGDAFSGLTDRLDRLYAAYSDDELALIAGFLAEAARLQAEATAELTDATPAGPVPGP